MFPSRSIPYLSETVDCPFGHTPAGNNICQPNQGKALRLTTSSLGTGEIFGINVLAKNQIEVKKSLTCAPIQVSEYIRTDEPGLDDTTTYLELGPVPGVSSYTIGYKPRSKEDNIGYQLFSLTSFGGGIWSPTDALKIPHGDVSVTIVAGNSVRYLEQANDPWFSAHRYDNSTKAYVADNDLSVIACMDQYQICNPAVGDASRCTILGSSNDVYKAHVDIGLSKFQTVLATRMLAVLGATPIWQAIDFEGVSAMLASRNAVALTSSGLPDNQWELEVRDWFETSLAAMQAAVIQYVNNLDQGALGNYASVTALGQEWAGVSEDYLCTSQRVRSVGGYVSFSLTWLVVVYCLGVVLILLSFAIEPVYGWVNKKSSGRDVIRTADLPSQILRKMLVSEQRGGDQEWTQRMKDVPVTGGTKMFLLPELRADDGDGSMDFLATRSEVVEEMRFTADKSSSAHSDDSEAADATTAGDRETNAGGKTNWLPRIIVSEQPEGKSLVDEALSEREQGSRRVHSLRIGSSVSVRHAATL